MAEGPLVDLLRLRPHGLSFDELRDLSEYLDRFAGYAEASLGYFQDKDTWGFDHRVEPGKGPEKNTFSKASTATCLAYLRATGEVWSEAWDGKRDDLRELTIRSNWRSAGLTKDNFFTVSFLL